MPLIPTGRVVSLRDAARRSQSLTSVEADGAAGSSATLILRLSSLPLRTITTSTSLPTGVSDDARQIARLLDLLAVELDDDIAGLEPGGLCRTIIDAGNERTTRRLNAEAIGAVVGHLLNLYAEPRPSCVGC
jgi:hypothetical protein